MVYGPSRRKVTLLFDLWVTKVKSKANIDLPGHLIASPSWAKVLASYMPLCLANKVEFMGLDATPGDILKKQENSDRLVVVLRSSQ